MTKTFKTCTEVIDLYGEPCPCKDCRNWMDYEEDLNCAVWAADEHGKLTFEEIGKRLGVSKPRIKQNEIAAKKKLQKLLLEYR